MAEAGCRVGCLRADPPLVILCVLELSAKHVLLPLHRLLPFFFRRPHTEEYSGYILVQMTSLSPRVMIG